MQKDIELQSAEQAETNERKSCACRWKWVIALAILTLVTIGVSAGVYFANRPEDIAVIQSTKTETSPSVVKVAQLSSVSNDAAVVLESTQSLTDDRATFHYVRLLNVDLEDLPNVQNLERLSLVLSTASWTDSSIDLSDPILVIERVASVEFPYNITGMDGIDSIQAVALMEDGTIIATASFGEPNIADDNSASSSPPILESSLSGSYGTQGTIRIDYSNEFVDGAIKAVPRLNFDLPNTVSAPGPYLYLSKRPFSETKGRPISANDIYIPLDESGGSFSVAGTFDQILDEVELEEIGDYANGSWVVWCRPFGVYIGGGSISEAM